MSYNFREHSCVGAHGLSYNFREHSCVGSHYLTSTRRNNLTPCASQTWAAMYDSHTQYACQTSALCVVSSHHTTLAAHVHTGRTRFLERATCAVPSFTYHSGGYPSHRGTTWKREGCVFILR
jgi:hypothetical protein